jgi:leucyl/phenylalanyl-tRNA--protein transferase
VAQLRERGYALFDIQMITPATRQLGAVEIPRIDYLTRLKRAIQLDCSLGDRA